MDRERQVVTRTQKFTALQELSRTRAQGGQGKCKAFLTISSLDQLPSFIRPFTPASSHLSQDAVERQTSPKF